MPYADDPDDLPHRLALTLTVSVVAGLLLAGALLPLVGGLGLVARAGAETFAKLPKELDDPPLPERSVVKYADGTTLATLYFAENRVVVPIDQIPEKMQLAILAIEDERFYQHPGVDWRGLLRAVVRNTQSDQVTQGGSTITQQYVKNVLIETASDQEGQQKAKERSLSRKVREARYALALEKKYTKKQILERYLNIAYFGQGVYGVGTAATHYFNRDVRRSEPTKGLTLDQAAILAGMVKNPTLYDPTKNPKNAERRRNLVLARMLASQFITQEEHDTAVELPVSPVIPKKSTNTCYSSKAPWFCDYLIRWLNEDSALGSTPEQRANRLLQGGLTITTTLDPTIQAAAQAALDKQPRLMPADRARAAAVAVILKPGTGAVLAMASNQVFGDGDGKTQINHALRASTYQAGSTFKMFMLAAAIKQGIPLNTRFAAPFEITFPKPDSKLRGTNGGKFTPDQFHNYAGGGTYDMPSATWHSVNNYYVQLEEKTGLDEPLNLAQQMGVDTNVIINTVEGRKPKREHYRTPSMALGTMTVSPLEMAEAYATLAAHGVHCDATPVLRIVDRSRNVVDQLDTTKACAHQPLSPGDADTVTSVLRGVVDKGTGRGAGIGRPAAGKTGTTSGYGAAWFCGYTPDLAGVTMLGHPKDPTPIANRLRNFHGISVSGGTIPASIWRDMMLKAHDGIPVSQFARPPAGAFLETHNPVPDVTGMTTDAAQKAIEEAGFGFSLGLGAVHANVPAGLVGQQIPGPGSQAAEGTTVTVWISDGIAPAPSPQPGATASPTGSPTPTGTPSPAPSPSPSSPGPSQSTTPQPTSSVQPHPTTSKTKEPG